MEQTQKIDDETPAFRFPLEFQFFVDQQDHARVVTIDEKVHEFTFAFDGQPTMFVVDPQNALLKSATLEVPLEMRQRQATSGPTVVSQLDAIEALSTDSGPDGVKVITTVLNDIALSPVVRSAAARALGTMQRNQALAALVDCHGIGIDDPEVAAAVLSALGRYPHSPLAHQILLEPFSREADVRVEAAAIMALGGMRARPEFVEQSLTRLRAAIHPSSRLWVRRTGLIAIGRLQFPGTYEAVLDVARPGHDDPIRTQAIRTLARLGIVAHHDQTRELFIRWLDDPDRLARVAAIDALGSLGDAKAVPDLMRLSGGAQHQAIRDAAQAAIQSIRTAKPDAGETAADLRQQVISLQQRQQKLQETVNELSKQLKRLTQKSAESD